VNKLKNLSFTLFFVLVCLIFPLNVFSMEKSLVYIEKFKIHSSEKEDQYLSEGIDSLLKSLVSSADGAVLTDSKSNEGFTISGSILIIENTSITSASLIQNKQIIESYNKKSDKKSDILNNINEVGILFKDIIESKTIKSSPAKFQKQPEKKQQPDSEIIFLSEQIPEEIIGITIVKSDYNNTPKIGWLTKTNFNISTITDGRLETIASLEIQPNFSPLWIESFNKGGKSMFIVNLFHNRNKSFKSNLYFLKNKTKTIIKDKSFPSNYFYKSADLASGEKIIIAKQGDFLKTELFRKGIKVLNTADFSFKDFHMKKDFEFFPGIAGGNFTKPDSNEWAFLKANGVIDFYSNDLKKIYESEPEYGGSVTFADYEQKGRDEIDSRYFFPTRVISIKGENNTDLLLSIKNQDGGSRLLQRLRFFKEGYISGISWDRISFKEVFSTRIFDGWISDFQLFDINNDGKRELIIANTDKSGGLGKNPKSRIIVLPFDN